MNKRIKAACRTNEPQITAVVLMTMMNGLALTTQIRYIPVWVIIAVLLFWPAIAFMANLYSPIPKSRDNYEL